MLEVINLTKKYNKEAGVENLNFKIEKGEIVGFLGPNGAGKTTTMRLITGYLYPDEGDVKVNENSILKNPLLVKKLIGYLPENNPLYDDLTVYEYLDFRGRLRGLKGRELRKRIEYSAERCLIKDVMKKLIGNCSKGYRQRIGLAEVLLSNPSILILDEPTQGLDPAQINHTREIIKSMGGEHTILLSTHILSEVESVCSKALLINKGKIIFDGSLKEMKNAISGKLNIKVTLLTTEEFGLKMLSQIPKVEKVEVLSENQTKGVSFILHFQEKEDLREEIFWKCYQEKVPIIGMDIENKSLEEAFLEMVSGKKEEIN